MMWSPIVAPALVIALALLGVALCAWRTPRAHAPLALRAVAIGVLAIAVLGPARTAEVGTRDVRTEVVVLFDGSASMRRLADGASVHERIATAWNDDALGALRERANVTIIDHLGRPLAARGGADRSPLVRTAGDVLRTIAPAHLVLLTDAIDTEGRTFADLDAPHTRVHALAMGGDAPVRDARITLVPGASLTYAGQPLTLRARVVQEGLTGRRGLMRLTRGGETIEQRVVRLDSATRLETFEVVPDLDQGIASATLAYTLELEPIAGEATNANNRATALALVSAEPIRVLVLEGQPHWDTRFFVRAMRADPQVEVTSASTLDDRFRSAGERIRVRLARSGPAGDDDRAVTLPATLDELAYYDVVVLGRAIEQFYPGRDSEILRGFVEQLGRSVVLLRGDPVVSDEPEALRTARVLRPLHEGVIERTLETGALRRVGAGFTLEADRSGYGDALRPRRERSESERYARAWSSVVRTLATGAELPPGADLALRARPTSARPGERVTLVVRARDASIALPVEAMVRTPSGAERRVAFTPVIGAPGLAEGSVVVEEEGVCAVRAGDGLETRFVVIEDRAEFLSFTPRTSETVALARATGGLVLGIDEGPERLVRLLDRVRSARAGVAHVEPVWDRWWLALVVGVALLGEWALRRRGHA